MIHDRHSRPPCSPAVKIGAVVRSLLLHQIFTNNLGRFFSPRFWVHLIELVVCSFSPGGQEGEHRVHVVDPRNQTQGAREPNTGSTLNVVDSDMGCRQHRTWPLRFNRAVGLSHVLAACSS